MSAHFAQGGAEWCKSMHGHTQWMMLIGARSTERRKPTLSAVLSRFQIQVHAPCTSSIALTIRAEAVRIVAISFGASYE